LTVRGDDRVLQGEGLRDAIADVGCQLGEFVEVKRADIRDVRASSDLRESADKQRSVRAPVAASKSENHR